jgi:zinc-ribbon domain
MQCSTCGNPLPTGATFCTNCGAKVNSQGSPGSQPYGSQVEPTIAASPSYGAPPNSQPPGQPPIPPTAYGSPSYNAPQQNPYEAPPPPPPPYTYGAPPTPSGSYGAPPTYGTPYAPPPGSFVPPGQQPPPRRKGPRVGLILGIVVLLLLVVGGGILAIRAATSGSKTNTSTPTVSTASPTPTTPAVTPTTQAQVPSGATIDPTAAAIVTKAQTSSAIDSNYFPTKVTNSFTVGQTVYVTFNLATNGQSGYTEAKLYSGTSYVGNKILTVQSNFDHGYFTVTLNQASTGTVELYWCTQSDCSDAKLATFVTFNVA